MTDALDIHSVPILIVDDCCDTASTLCELLTLKGFRKVSWVTGYDASSNRCSAHYYGLLLLDMHMSAISGLDVMHHLRNTKPEPSVPVIAISGDQRYRTVAIEAGACAFLLKPFDHGEVEAAVYNALSTH